MAFAITSAKAYGIEVAEPVTNRFKQILQFTVTAGASDLVYAIGDLTSQFWTDVNNATYKNLWSRVQAKTEVITVVAASAIKDPKIKVGSAASLAAGQYKEVTTPSGLSISVYTGESVATAVITIEAILQANVLPEEYNNV